MKSDTLQIPPTEIEISEALATCHGTTKEVFRRLAYQYDRLQSIVDKLPTGTQLLKAVAVLLVKADQTNLAADIVRLVEAAEVAKGE